MSPRNDPQTPPLTQTDPEQWVAELMRHWGDDPAREGLKNTPKRFLRAMEFLTQGYQQNLDDIINGALFSSPVEEMVIVTDIEFYSLCEHHLLPFTGRAHVGYLPNGKVLGLSKIARLVDFFARRLQIQESLTEQIAQCLLNITDARGVGVVIEAEHMCMKMRGVQKQQATMRTSSMLEQFRTKDRTRAEFLNLIR